VQGLSPCQILSLVGCSLPSTGSLGLVPPLHWYCKALRLPAALPASLRCLRFAVPSLRLGFAPADARRSICGPGLVYRTPQNRFLDGGDRSSQVPGGPHCVHALLSDPGGTSALGHYRASVLSSALCTTSTPATTIFRGSITRPAHSLSTLRRMDYSTATQDSLPVGWPALSGWDSIPTGPQRKVSDHSSSSPRLRLAHA
jgi:hypothetical protein